MFYNPITAAAAAGMALSILATPLAAQNAETDPAPAPVEAAEYSDAEILAFAEAALAVVEVRDQYAQQLADAASEEEQQQIVEEGNAAMVAAVENAESITVEDYLEIGEAAAANPELDQRIAMAIEQMMAEEPSDEVLQQ